MTMNMDDIIALAHYQERTEAMTPLEILREMLDRLDARRVSDNDFERMRFLLDQHEKNASPARC